MESDSIHVQYVGFQSKASVHQHIFCAREAPSELRAFIPEMQTILSKVEQAVY